MINQDDQLKLFEFISKNLKQDITCYAFGGTAMMFYGYKEETKDIDLLFKSDKDRAEFINAIKTLGFQELSPFKIYLDIKLKEKNKPLMYKRNDYRFDLFSKSIFKTKLSPNMQEDKYAVHEFRGKNTLKIIVLRKEHIVFLKAITERQNDFDDILNILEKNKHFDWQYLIDETLWQDKNGNSWAILDVKKTLQALKDYIFIENTYFKQLYKS